ncbi:unnamed protein product [Cylindrotheca closterium]|uniref:Protein arginine N-methyltransferase n=1 Tax=Cylindrotheca closterium TaxID=2856 RepID=A0AAD2CRV5_9STRA|nr:unnamed protein product [Cylindrotheca closterium]
MSSEITQALQTARFNDLVHINVQEGDDDQEAREIILKASLDRENGGIQWMPLPEDVNLTKLHLSTKRWFFPMLNDTVRNKAYDEAIQLASEEVVRRFYMDGKAKDDNSPPSIHGLDIGSGTGLLAMLSAKHLKKSLDKLSIGKVQIESLEMSSVMAQLAKNTIASNQLQDSIRVSERHSCEMESLSSKAHFCTSELLESGLLAEGWLPAMRDAWKRHLDPKAIVVPQKAKVWAQIVEGTSLGKFWGPHHLVNGEFGDNRVLKLWRTEGKNRKYLLQPSSEEMAGIQMEVHAKELLDNNNNNNNNITKYPLKLLSDPISILDIDVTSVEAMPPEGGQSKTREFIPIASGVAHAVLFWWELDLYQGKVTYNTHHDQEFQDHWQQCLFIFTKDANELSRLRQGEPTLLKGSHSESKVSFEIFVSNTAMSDEQMESKRPKTAPSEGSDLISPDRAWQLNDLERIDISQKGILFALNKIGMDQSIALDVSDFSLCAMMASMLGCPLVYSMESSSSNNVIPLTSAQIAQISNGLPYQQDETHDFQILQCHPEQITTTVLNEKKPNLVIAEPYYEILEGWHIQEALNYFNIVSALKKRGVLQEPFYSVPACASVMVCAFESKDIGSAYTSCSDSKLCGFLHHAINAESPLNEYEIRIPSWQYDIRHLTKPEVAATIDYQAGTIREEQIMVNFETSGTCHGILLWVDYHIAIGDDQSKIISTSGRGHQQIVRMLPSPIDITVNQVVPAVDGRASLKCKSRLQEKETSFVDFEIVVE